MQQAKKENWILLIILPMIALVCFWIWSTRVDTGKEVIVYSDTPEWDLRGYDFDKTFVRARGNVAEYVPNALLTPEEFENANYIAGQPKNAADYLTSRFRLYVPDGKVYALTTDSADFADRIYINGQLFQEIGRPASNREDMVPGQRAQYYTVTPEGGVIEIVQQVSNFVHRDGGNPTGFRIGSIETAGRHYDRKLNMASMVMGACLLLFLVHMVLYLMQRRYKANLYFSLFCLVWFFFTGFAGQRVFVALYPQIGWTIAYHIESVAVPLSTLLLTLALSSMFPGLVQRKVKIAAITVCCAGAVFSLFADTLTLSYARQVYDYAFVAILVYVAARFLWRFRKKRSVEGIIVFTGLCVYGYAMVRDLFYHYHFTFFPMVYANFMDFAILVFILFTMVASFYGTMRQVAEAREKEIILTAEKALLEKENTQKQALLERAEQTGQVFTKGALSLDAVSGQAFLRGKDMLLTQKEFAVLLLFVQGYGQLIPKERLYEAAWNKPLAGDDTAVKTAVSRLRKKLAASGFAIEMARGKGYRLVSKEE